MAESTNVNLPRSHVARFPNRCVVCDCFEPTSHVWHITGTICWGTWLLGSWGKAFVAKAPACRRCAWKLYLLRFASLTMVIVLTLFSIWSIWPHFQNLVPPNLRKVAGVGLAILCLLPQAIFEMFFAKPFSVSAFSRSVDYEFSRKDYALSFAMLNRDAVWVKINGSDLDL